MPEPLIKLTDVCVTYAVGKTNETPVLKNISLEIYEGEYIVFFGPSGCGKSTLMYTIAGLERPTSGQVLVEGKDLAKQTSAELTMFHRNTIGMVFQAFYLVPHLSARDNLILAKMFFGGSKPDREAKAEELMQRFGITSYANRRPAMMSGGQQQRTAIARALMNDPKIIMADEPVGNLDSKNSIIVLELLADVHRKEKKTIIQVTHNARDVHYANRVFYLKDGQIQKIVVNSPEVMNAPPEQVLDAEGQPLKQTALDKAAEDSPNLSAARLKAKMIFRHLAVPFTEDAERHMELSIADYIAGKITKEELHQALLDKKDGAGLNSQTAINITREVGILVDGLKKLEAKTDFPTPTDKQKAEAQLVGEHARENYGGVLSREQVRRLDIFIHHLITKNINHEEFVLALHTPVEEKGVGLNKRSAQHFAEKVNVMLKIGNII